MRNVQNVLTASHYAYYRPAVKLKNVQNVLFFGFIENYERFGRKKRSDYALR